MNSMRLKNVFLTALFSLMVTSVQSSSTKQHGNAADITIIPIYNSEYRPCPHGLANCTVTLNSTTHAPTDLLIRNNSTRITAFNVIASIPSSMNVSTTPAACTVPPLSDCYLTFTANVPMTVAPTEITVTGTNMLPATFNLELIQ